MKWGPKTNRTQNWQSEIQIQESLVTNNKNEGCGFLLFFIAYYLNVIIIPFPYLYKEELFFPSFSSYFHWPLCIECGGVYGIYIVILYIDWRILIWEHNKLEKQWHNPRSPNLGKQWQMILPQDTVKRYDSGFSPTSGNSSDTYLIKFTTWSQLMM